MDSNIIDNSLSAISVDDSNRVSCVFKANYFKKDSSKEILLKNRGTKKKVYLSVNQLGLDEYEFCVDFSYENLGLGIWDISLVESFSDDKVYTRLKLHSETIAKDFESFYIKSNDSIREISIYQTVNQNLSFSIEEPQIKLSIEQLEVNGWKAFLEGSSTSSILHTITEDSVLCRLQKRHSEDYYEFDMDIVFDELNQKYILKTNITFENIINDLDNNIGRWQLYCMVKINNKYEAIPIVIPKERKGHILCTNDLEHNGKNLQGYLYITKGKEICFVVEYLKIRRSVEKIRIRNGRLFIKGWAFLFNKNSNPDSKRYLIIRKRYDEEDIFIPLPNNRREEFKNRFKNDLADYTWSGFDVSVKLKGIYNSSNLTNGIWDLFIGIEYNGELVTRKLGYQRFVYKKDRGIGNTIVRGSDDTKELYFSLTPRGNIKIEVLEFHFLRKLLTFFSPLLYYFYFKRKDIWIVGERPDTAQDTGYHFFRHCRENYPNRMVFYAIDENSKDVEKIKDLGNVLYLYSFKHFLYSLFATTFVSSHDIEYFIPFKGYKLHTYRNAKKVFIQHGILGRKNIEYNYTFYDYPFDMFCVSSEGEKQVVLDKLGYPSETVKITGLSRYDALPLEPSRDKERKKILCIPTWREWLNTSEKFLESEYYKNYSSLIKSDRLHNLLEKYNVELIFYPHYRMQPYIDLFEVPDNDRIKIIKLGEVGVQELLISTDLMITDYSSVSFDYTYMSKPVIFYHFDFEKFFERGILRPPEETFLGSIVNNLNALLEELDFYARNDFKEKAEIDGLKPLIFSYIDKNNCERIYKNIGIVRRKKHYPRVKVIKQKGKNFIRRVTNKLKGIIKRTPIYLVIKRVRLAMK